MDLERLHSSTLEKLFGEIEGDIIKQDEHFRIVRLKDHQNMTRTLGVVRFFEVDHAALKIAHPKILAGGMLGKTLFDASVAFDKEPIGSFLVILPQWAKKEFKTQNDLSLVIYSKILVQGSASLTDNFVYAELIEIIPPCLTHEFANKTGPLHIIGDDLLRLVNAVDLIIINQIK
jgi:hypothetical protein